MNTDTLVVVCAYAGDINQVRNNMPYYQHHKCPVVVMSPTDAPIASEWAGVEARHVGLKGWIGPQTLERQRLMLEQMLTFPVNFFLANDADSVCLSPEFPRYLYDPGVIWSNEVLDTNPGPSLLPKVALQPPYFFSRRAIEGMLHAAATGLPTSYYSGRSPEGWPLPHPTQCIDHWMLQAASGSGCEHRNFHDGASFETNSPHGLDTMSGVVRDHGRIFLHSIKTPEAITRLAKDHAHYRITH